MTVKKRPIYLNLTDELFAALRTKLSKTPLSGTSINLNLESLVEKNYAQIPEPRIYFTEHAYVKTMALVDSCDSEVAWHGIVSVENGNYIITDILVYPQTVTGATVTTDKEAYALWNLSLDNNTVNNLRLQGHSHVNMTVIPSGTDKAYYQELLEHIKDYYIFLITNKRREIYFLVYDVVNNVAFEDVPLTGIISENGELLNDWVAESLKEVKKVVPITKTYSVYENRDYNHFKGYKYAKEDAEDEFERDAYQHMFPDLEAPKRKPGRPKGTKKK